MRRGCCPYAKMVYGDSHAERCCTNRLHEIQPLQAIGGLDFSHLITEKISILIQGDSLAEQHFIFMMCFAWSSGEKVHFRKIRREKDIRAVANEEDLRSFGMYEAKIGSLTITCIKWFPMTLVPTINIEEPDFMLVSAWHHENIDGTGGYYRKKIGEYFSQIKEKRSKPTIVVEALPGHFPGGSWRADMNYPPVEIHYSKNQLIQKDPVCNSINHNGTPNINSLLEELVEKDEKLFLLRVSNFLANRGDAHIGKIPQGRDCLHYCVVPGIYDVIAKRTIAVIVRIMMIKKQ